MKLTLPQQDIYYEQLLYPGEPIYNIGAKIEVVGMLDVDILQKAYDELINQHDAYRIALQKNKDDNEVALNIQESHTSKLGFIDFMDHDHPEAVANSYMKKEFTTAFDIIKDQYLHKFILIKVAEEKHYLFSVYHHIITDGWGTSLMFQRWVQNYNELLEYGSIQTSYPYSYKDFVRDDLNYQNSKAYDLDKTYWVEKFKNLPENLFEKVNNNKEHKSKRKVLTINRKVYDQLNALATTTKTSTFHLILSILYLYFSRKHHNRDFAIGLPVLNRSKSIFKKTVGLFMGVTALRIQVDPESTILDLVNLIKNELRQNYRYQRFPLGKLIQELQLFNQKERLFNMTLSYEKQDYKNNFKATKTRVIPMTHQSERVALAMYVREFDPSEDVHIDFDYNLNYFDESTITEVVSHFDNLLHSVLENPSQKVREVNFLLPNEEKKILQDFNKTEVFYDTEKTFLHDFEDHVRKNPEAIAVKDDLGSYSYAKINELSNKIAAYLCKEFGDQEKLPVAVMMNRSANMIALLLGIMKSGRAYIPLDPLFPIDRLKYILQNSEAKLLIYGTNDNEIVHAKGVYALAAQEVIENAQELAGIAKSKAIATDLAYIIYTSGSTGNPKGVKIGHRSLYNFLLSIQNTPGINSDDLLFSVTTYSFDISILEFFAPLLSGAGVYIASNTILSDPSETIAKIKEIAPSIIQGTPSFYQMLFNAGWQGDRGIKMMCGGDLLSKSLADKLIKNSSELWNMYGPTECTIWSSIKKIETPEHASNIGTPIYNTQFYILDDFLNPMPVGAYGNIYIGGDGLAIGYHEKPTLTKQKFIQSPFDQQKRIYETGDVGMWNDKGEIEFLGRNDNQVKIRGYRIELGDIETKINLIDGITGAVVIAKKRDQQDDFLVAYITAKEQSPTKNQIISNLKKELPAYMIPYAIVHLDAFPLTPNNKIDRKKLIQQDILVDALESEIEEAQTALEIQLTVFWKEVLQIDEQIDRNQNFFALGGNSLNAVRLINYIQQDFLIKINLKTIFDYPTIASLAAYLESKEKEEMVSFEVATSKDYYNITPAQYGIWLASQQQNKSIAYNMGVAYEVVGVLDVDKITAAINQCISRHEILRTNFVERNGTPFQKINKLEPPFIDIAIQVEEKNKISSAIQDFVSQEFDLETDILMSVKLFRSKRGTDKLVFLTHHIVMDGWSLEILIKEIISNYNNQFFGTGTNGNKNLLQFKDYSEWYLKEIEKSNTKNQHFWDTYLEGFHYQKTFQPDYLTNSDVSNGDEYIMVLEKNIVEDLKKLIVEQKTTMHTLLITALNALIYKISNQIDITIGTVHAGRETTMFTDTIGMFVKTLPLRTKIKEEESFIDVLKNTERNLLNISMHQDIPKENIQKTLYDVLLVYQNEDFSYENINEFNGIQLQSIDIKNTYSRLPVSFNFFEKNSQLIANINFNVDQYQVETIEMIAYQFKELLEQITKEFSLELKDIELQLPLESTKTVDFDFNF